MRLSTNGSKAGGSVCDGGRRDSVNDASCPKYDIKIGGKQPRDTRVYQWNRK